MPGYEPFLLCDFHVHTSWSDGRLSLREVVDLYGKTRRFDVIAITDHILIKRDLLARAGRLLSLGRREFSVTEERFPTYLEDIAAEGRRARKLYDLLVIPGAEITQNHIRSKRNAHIVALNINEHISADQPAEDILHAIRRAGRAEHRVPSAPSDDEAVGDRDLLPLGSTEEARPPGRCLGSGQSRRPVLGDEPHALPVRGEQRLSQAEAPVLVEDAATVREDMGGDRADASGKCGHRADAVPQRLLGDVRSIGGQGSVRCDRGQRADASPPPVGTLFAERWAPIDFRLSICGGYAGSGSSSHRYRRSPTS